MYVQQFTRISQNQPDFIPVGLLVYAGDDAAASAASGVITGSETAKVVLEKTEVPVQVLHKDLTNLFRYVFFHLHIFILS